MEIRYIMGLDPGKAGASAWVDLKNRTFLRIAKILVQGDELSVRGIADEILANGSPDEWMVIIEKVHAMPGQGVSSMFSFGTSYGKLIGMCQSLGIAFDLVTPQAWKKVVLEGTAKDKPAAIAFCQRRYPKVNLVLPGCRKPHDGIADAICLMEWGVNKYG